MISNFTASLNSAGLNAGSRRWITGAGVILVVIVGVALGWPGCRQYPPVSHPESLQLVKLLYTACNTRDAQRLAAVEAELAKLALPPAEQAAFQAIVTKAKAGDWTAAEQAAFRFAQDQVR